MVLIVQQHPQIYTHTLVLHNCRRRSSNFCGLNIVKLIYNYIFIKNLNKSTYLFMGSQIYLCLFCIAYLCWFDGERFLYVIPPTLESTPMIILYANTLNKLFVSLISLLYVKNNFKICWINQSIFTNGVISEKDLYYNISIFPKINYPVHVVFPFVWMCKDV